MKHLLLLLFFALPLLTSTAQKVPFDETPYLAGAVPEQNGVIVFAEHHEVPGRSRAELVARLEQYVRSLVDVPEKLPTSRLTEVSPDSGLVAASVAEYLWFKRNSLVWDRATVRYQLVVQAKEGAFDIMMRNIRYAYEPFDRNGEETFFPAEEWITDHEALKRNGKLTKVGGRKFRVKTIDRKNEIFAGARRLFQD